MRRLRSKIALALLILIVGGALLPSLPGHAYAGEAIVPAPWLEANPGPYVVDVAVAVDEEWLDLFGPEAGPQARLVLETVAVNFRPAGLNLRLSRLFTWPSADDVETVHPLLEELKQAGAAADADIVVGLTAGRYRGKVDGVARAREPYIVVRHHRQEPRRDAYVLTHELGHVLGLDHHTCRDRLCFMADHGYDPKEHWCPDHLELLKANAGYFRYGRDADAQV